MASLNNRLLNCVDLGDTDGVLYCIERGADVDCYNGTVARAAKNNNFRMVELLISNGAKRVDKALVNACTNGNIAMVDFLIRNGADVNYNGSLPLIVVCRRYNVSVDLAELLIKYGVNVGVDDNICLMEASYSGKAKLVKILLDNGAEVNARDGAALINAIMSRGVDVVKELISSGANIHSRGGKSALREAIEYAYDDIVLLLINSGMYLEVHQIEGIIRNGLIATLMHLMEKFDDIHSICNMIDMERSIKGCIKNGHLDVIKFLVSKGLDVGPYRDFAIENAWNKKVVDFIRDAVKYGSSGPRNNDRRDKCYWCGAETDSINTGFSIMNICNICGK